jgi:hypothetical protein
MRTLVHCQLVRSYSLLLLLSVLGATPVLGQKPKYAPGEHFSRNMKLVGHLPLAPQDKVADIELEQDLARPYAYVSRNKNPAGFQIVDLKDPAKPRLIHSWFIEDAELHDGSGLKGMYFKLKGRYYYAQSFQFRNDPDKDLVAVIFDVTGLPDVTKVKEVGRIRTPDMPGGAHNMFAYKHSDGRVLLFTTIASAPTNPYGAAIWDMERFLAGDAKQGLAGYVPLPEPRGGRSGGYHDAYAAYDPVTKQDRFYGGGPETSPMGGNFVFDITDVSNPKLLASIIAQPSLQSGGHTFIPTPDGRYGMTIMTSPGHQPVRFWDLKPALDGKQPVISMPIGEWAQGTPQKSSHMIELRWPYAFIAAYQDGLQVLDVRDPTAPYVVGFYDTYARAPVFEGGGVALGAFGVDVRNADGLIVIADETSGFWSFKMDGFDGWNGNNWGVPNSSSVQDWDRGPEGVSKPKPVT